MSIHLDIALKSKESLQQFEGIVNDTLRNAMVDNIEEADIVTGRVHFLRYVLAKLKRGRIDIRQIDCRNGCKGLLRASDRPV